MADPRSEGLVRYAAPYIADTVTLLSYTHDGDSAVFYRCGDASFSRPPIDCFSTGTYQIREMPWTSVDLKNSSSLASSLCLNGFALAGYVSYEAGYSYERKWENLQHPQNGYAWRFLEIPAWYQANHETKSGTIITIRNCDAEVYKHLTDVVMRAALNGTHKPDNCGLLSVSVGPFGELSESTYSDKVNCILEDIASGRYYELNFTQRFRMSSQRHPLDCFQAIFRQYEPRRAYYAQFPDEIVCSCSPELFLKKEGTRISTRPIKGSLPEGGYTREREKLRAEHIMVVDLARNDLGRISNLGWVNVPELFVENEFGGLKHLESLVVGDTSLSIFDILPFTYPPASITGAPKVEVVRAIADYEESRRGIYTGSCGWIWPDGDFDLNVAIRTYTAVRSQAEWRYEVGAGGAIVADSDPGSEYEECLRKATPLISAIGPTE